MSLNSQQASAVRVRLCLDSFHISPFQKVIKAIKHPRHTGGIGSHIYK